MAEGRLQEGVQQVQAWLTTHEQDDHALLGLGVLQFVQGVEGLAQDLYRYGLRDVGRRVGIIPFLRLPVPENPEPEPLTYEAAREIIARFIRQFETAEGTLARVDGPVKLPIHVAAIRLDMDGDGKAVATETLWTIYERLNRGAGEVVEDPESFVIALDRADVHWLRGYCHLLVAFGEFALAHDGQEIFERTAHVFFAKVDSPYPFLAEGRRVFQFGAGIDVVDFVAFIHLLNFPVVEPERMAAAHGHLKNMLDQSRAMWKHAVAETDDEHEWIPSANQSSAIPNVGVNQQMIDDWHLFLDEADALLDGTKLIPFWRGGQPQGVNLRKVFLEPRPFDLVLWIQGTAAAPHLERGELTRPETWERLQRTFQGNLLGFAIWFN